MAEVSFVRACGWCEGKVRIIDVSGELVDDRLLFYIDVQCMDCGRARRDSATFESMLKVMLKIEMLGEHAAEYARGAILPPGSRN